MSGAIKIELTVVEPIILNIALAPVYSIGTAQAGPRGEGLGDHETTYNHDEFVSSSEITTIKQLTAAEYAALTPKVNTTMYVIVG